MYILTLILEKLICLSHDFNPFYEDGYMKFLITHEITHGLKLVDYLLIQVEKPWYNCYLSYLSKAILDKGTSCILIEKDEEFS